MRAAVFHCLCGAIVVPPTKSALKLIVAAGACHACRLAKTVEFLRQNNVELLDDVLRFTEGYEGFRLATDDIDSGAFFATKCVK